MNDENQGNGTVKNMRAETHRQFFGQEKVDCERKKESLETALGKKMCKSWQMYESLARDKYIRIRLLWIHHPNQWGEVR